MRKCRGCELNGGALTQAWGAMQEGPSQFRQDSQQLVHLPTWTGGYCAQPRVTWDKPGGYQNETKELGDTNQGWGGEEGQGTWHQSKATDLAPASIP